MRLVLLGSTGSIGLQTLEVAERLKLSVTALAAGKRIDILEAQARKFHPKAVAVFDESAAETLKIRLADTDIAVYAGMAGICALVQCGDTVLNAVVGIAGLRPTLAAIEAGKTVALANKESLVTGGELVMRRAREQGVSILPVDSEHSAVFQSLQGVPQGSLAKIILTASGGPFFGKTRSELATVTAAQALKHPNWSMGNKITIDSATMMNKGLEVIEAAHLFGLPPEQIEVYIHRQSVLHSGVELRDGAVLAQLGTPDMRLPIQYALTYPKRAAAFEHLNLFEIGTLTFERPDTETFRCLPLCVRAIKQGGLCPTVVNGANEVAVELFLAGKISFLQIADLAERAMEVVPHKSKFSAEDIFEADAAARRSVLNAVGA